MKVLLDENIDVRFKHHFPDGYTVYTVKDMDWNGIKNGELLLLIKENAFDAWVVVDKNIPYQQNINTLPCLVVVLDVYRNTLKHLLPLIPKVLEALHQQVDKVVVVR